MMVPGYEHHTFECSTCGEVERRLVFNRIRRSPTGRMVQIDCNTDEATHVAKDTKSGSGCYAQPRSRTSPGAV